MVDKYYRTRPFGRNLKPTFFFNLDETSQSPVTPQISLSLSFQVKTNLKIYKIVKLITLKTVKKEIN